MRKRQPKVIGAAVRDYRTRLGMTQLQVAELADVAPETLSRIERNKLAASLDLARRLADALEVKVDDLFTARPAAAKRRLRVAELKLLALLRRLDEPQIDDITRALRLMLEVGASVGDREAVKGGTGRPSREEG
jgi:transcriptional regulator with XRE-family HTH domain